MKKQISTHIELHPVKIWSNTHRTPLLDPFLKIALLLSRTGYWALNLVTLGLLAYQYNIMKGLR